MLMKYANYDVGDLTRKATLDRVSELALLLKEPRQFGFATMPCLGVVTDLNDKRTGSSGDVKLIYELPPAADPLAHPVSLHDLLSLEEYRSEEPPEVDVRFKLVSLLANSLYEMHCTGWLHRNISSKSIYFLMTKQGSGIESFDLEKLTWRASMQRDLSQLTDASLIDTGTMTLWPMNILDICSTTVGHNPTQSVEILAINCSICLGMTITLWAWSF